MQLTIGRSGRWGHRPAAARTAHASAATAPAAAIVAMAASLLLVGTAARGQAPSMRPDANEPQRAVGVPPSAPRIEVRKIRMEGIESIDESEARDTLKTRRSSCRLILLAPLCRWTPTLFLVNKKYLDRETVAEDATRIQVLYWRHGFREARVDTVITQRRGHRTATVTFRITEGPPTTLRALDVAHRGTNVLGDARVARALRDASRPGAPFDVIALERAMLELRNALWDEGYADAQVTAAVSRPDTITRSVSATVTLAPGEPTRIGRIEVEGNRAASEETVRSALSLRPGELFRRRDVMASQRYLIRSALFERALIITPQPAEGSNGGGRVVTVTVNEGPARRARVGAGFSTVDFLQTSALFTHNNFLGGARRLDVRGALTNVMAGALDGRAVFRDVTPPGLVDADRDRFLAPMWQAGVTLTQPWLGSPRNSAGVSAFAHRRSAPAVFVDRGAGGEATLARELAERVTVGASYRAERTRVDAADAYFCGSYGVCEAGAARALRAPAWLAPAAVALLADRADDPDFPTAGFSARLEGEAAAAATGSDFRHARLFAEGTAYRALGSGGTSVVAVRVRGGAARPLGGGGTGSAGDVLHPRKRFYAGGLQSARGYGENRLGPRALLASAEDLIAAGCSAASVADGSCDPAVLPAGRMEAQPLGGGTLLEASAEWRIGLRDGLGAAIFADGAYVGTRGGGAALRALARGRGDVTPGAGLRVYSPLGVLRLDLGLRLRTAERLPVLVDVEDGAGGRRVVRLSADRRYDELEGARGTLGRTLRRLTLHFTIGQAF